ncbi:MAG: sulfite exporter TauE/SafE family protein [Alphaproteobacteria bacterium]|nr:sulfite exporter TauE/SafE family protein [Alphaproteobacteria bacterium]
MTALFILVVTFCTSFISGILGMAGGMILMGVLAWILPVSQAMMLHAVAQFFSNASRAWFHRQHIYKPSIAYYVAGLALTVGVFTGIAYMPGKATVFLLLGSLPFIGYVLSKQVALDFTKPRQAFLCGMGVTFFHLTAGVSGPLLDIFFQNASLPRHQTVATKALTQSIAHVVKFVYFGVVAFMATGQEDSVLSLWIFFAVVPVAVSGTHVSRYVLDKMSDNQFYRATQIVLFMLGIVYLCKGLFAHL